MSKVIFRDERDFCSLSEIVAKFSFLLATLMCLVCTPAFAHDIEVKNSDGVTIYYNYINNQTELEVSYQGTNYHTYSDEYTGEVVIPASVTYNGKTYSVTNTGNEAFNNCQSLKSVTFPNSLTGIGNSAFCNCSGLTSMTIPNSVKNIGNGTFYQCSSLTSVTALRTDPMEFNCSSNAFDYSPTSSATLNVPVGCVTAYANLIPWSYFGKIFEGVPTGIEPIELRSDEAYATYYNVQGKRIAQPQRGQIVIIRYSDGTSKKVRVK